MQQLSSRRNISIVPSFNMRFYWLGVIAIMAGLSITGASHADDVTFSGMAIPPADTGTVSGVSPEIYIGEYDGTLDGNSFLSFCFDLSKELSFGTAYTDYTSVALNSLTSLFSSTQISDVDKLFNNDYAAAQLNPTNSAAFQLSLWEIEQETSGSYNLSSGSFSVTSISDPNAIMVANTWLNNLSTESAGTIDPVVLESPTAQNVIAVPEPSIYATILSGLGFLGFVALRRKQKETASQRSLSYS